MIMNIAERNRKAKATLERAFGRGKVRVRGGRGTAYRWLYIDIAHQPRDSDQAGELVGLCRQLLKAAHIDLGKCWPDDGTDQPMDECGRLAWAGQPFNVVHPTMLHRRGWYWRDLESSAIGGPFKTAEEADDDLA